MLQWGRTCEGAEIMGQTHTTTPTQSLQWGRTCEGAEIQKTKGKQNETDTLQWGRTCEGAEMRDGWQYAVRRLASMGPHL